MKKVIVLLAAASLSMPTWANDVIIYPAGGQSVEQQQKDTVECRIWATDKTGVDPVKATDPAQLEKGKVGGERVRGAAGGALAGAVIGALVGDPGTGAAIGAAAGTMSGGAKQRRTKRQNRRALEQAKADRKTQLETFNRAYHTCLRGRNYTLS